MLNEIIEIYRESAPYLNAAVVGVAVSIALLGIAALVVLRRGRTHKRPPHHAPLPKGLGYCHFYTKTNEVKIISYLLFVFSKAFDKHRRFLATLREFPLL